MRHKIIISILIALIIFLLFLLYMSSPKRLPLSDLKVSIFNQDGITGLIIDHPNHPPFCQITMINVEYTIEGKILLERYVIPFNIFNHKIIFAPWPMLITENLYPGREYQLEYWDNGYKPLAKVKVDTNGEIILLNNK